MPVTKALWRSICNGCAGAIDSVVELLQGRLARGVMERICRQNTGLFPSPKEIRLSCSCPDSASMCKHVAAVLYGIGTRFGERPELLFRLHELNEEELIAKAGKALPLAKEKPAPSKVLASADLADIFGLDFAPGTDGDTGGRLQGRSRRVKKCGSAKELPLRAPDRGRPKTAPNEPAPQGGQTEHPFMTTAEHRSSRKGAANLTLHSHERYSAIRAY
jgi:hypothetical protein